MQRARTASARLLCAGLIATLAFAAGSPARGAPPAAASEIAPGHDAGRIDVDLDPGSGRLLLDVRDAALEDVLRHIARAAHAELIVYGTLDERVTARLAGASLREGLTRLLERGGHSSVVEHAGRAAPGAAAAVARIIVLPSKRGPMRVLASPAPPVDPQRALRIKQYRLMRAQRDGGEDGMDALIALALTDDDPFVRASAVMSLEGYDDAKAATALAQALQDDDPAVRLQAIRVYGAVGGAEAVTPLAAILAGDPDPGARLMAVHGLRQIGTPAARSALSGALRDPEQRVARAAAQALGR